MLPAILNLWGYALQRAPSSRLHSSIHVPPFLLSGPGQKVDSEFVDVTRCS